MNVRSFLDTNILVYAYDRAYPQKQRIAQALLLKASQQELVVSTQVLAEFSSTLFHKMSPAAKPDQVVQALNAVKQLRVVPTTEDIVHRAIEARREYGIHFYDGMILGAAEFANCTRIFSEDFNNGQRYFGMVVENPFV